MNTARLFLPIWLNFLLFPLFLSRETELAALPEAEHVWPILSQTGGWWWWWWGCSAPSIPYLSRKVYCCRSRAAAPRFMLQLSQGRGITQGAGAVHMDAAACHQTHRHTSKKKNLRPEPTTHFTKGNLPSDPQLNLKHHISGTALRNIPPVKTFAIELNLI